MPTEQQQFEAMLSRAKVHWSRDNGGATIRAGDAVFLFNPLGELTHAMPENEYQREWLGNF